MVLCSSAVALPADAPAHDTISLGHSEYGPTIPASLSDDAQPALTLLFDTGAGITIFDQASVDADALEFVQAVNVASGGDNRVVASMYVTGLIVGSRLETARQPVLVMDLKSKGGPFVDGIDGILNPETIGPLIGIDFAAGLVTRSPARPTGPGSSFLPEADLPAIRITVAGEVVHAVLDSGARDFLSLPADWLERIEFEVAPTLAGGARTVAGESQVLSGKIRGDVVIAGKRYEQPLVSFQPDQNLVLIGTEALRDFRVTIDYSAKQSWATPIAD